MGNDTLSLGSAHMTKKLKKDGSISSLISRQNKEDSRLSKPRCRSLCQGNSITFIPSRCTEKARTPLTSHVARNPGLLLNWAFSGITWVAISLLQLSYFVF